MNTWASELNLICRRAGLITERYRQLRHFAVDQKSDGSPVTVADRDSNATIVSELTRLSDGAPIISEEDLDKHEEQILDDYWIVDPLDGTRDYCAGNEDYTVNICRIYQGQPQMGCIYHPPSETFYFASQGQGAFMRTAEGDFCKLMTENPSRTSPRILLSRSHASCEYELAAKVWPHGHIVAMSSALKFAKLAEGFADVYFREGATMEWDTAAGQLLVEQAGGAVVDWQCQRLTYSKKGRVNPGFMAVADRNLLQSTYALIGQQR